MPATNGDDVLGTTYEGEALDGLAGDDVLESAFNKTTLLGSGGDDTLTTVFLPDELRDEATSASQYGGAGNDRLYAELGTYDIEGPVEGEQVFASIYQDGGIGDDVIEARLSDYAFSRGLLSAEIHGGAGNDAITALSSLETFAHEVMNSIYGDGGDDTITALAVTSFFSDSDSATNLIYGGFGNDVIEATTRGISNGGDYLLNSLYGGLGNDSLTAISYSNSNSGSQTVVNEVFGEQGNDYLAALFTSSGADTGADVTVTLDGGSGHDVLLAQTETALEFGGYAAIAHTMIGGDGRDEMTSTISTEWSDYFNLTVDQSGGAGADTLSSMIEVSDENGFYGGSTANNRLTGDDGGDALSGAITLNVYELSSSLDVQNDFSGGSGNDTIDAALTVVFSVDSYASEGTYDIGVNLLAGDDGNDTLSGSVAVENNLTDATFTGHSELYGGDGHDRLTVTGGTGNILDGGTGNDTLVGGDGEDRLIGGEGFDTLTGGLGADTFVFNVIETGYRRDIVTDFTSGTDTIALAIDAFTSLSSYGLGVLDTEALSYGSTASSADDYLFYDADTGTLYYDADGTGVEARTTLAVFTDAPSLLADDIYLI